MTRVNNCRAFKLLCVFFIFIAGTLAMQPPNVAPNITIGVGNGRVTFEEDEQEGVAVFPSPHTVIIEDMNQEDLTHVEISLVAVNGELDEDEEIYLSYQVVEDLTLNRTSIMSDTIATYDDVFPYYQYYLIISNLYYRNLEPEPTVRNSTGQPLVRKVILIVQDSVESSQPVSIDVNVIPRNDHRPRLVLSGKTSCVHNYPLHQPGAVRASSEKEVDHHEFQPGIDQSDSPTTHMPTTWFEPYQVAIFVPTLVAAILISFIVGMVTVTCCYCRIRKSTPKKQEKRSKGYIIPSKKLHTPKKGRRIGKSPFVSIEILPQDEIPTKCKPNKGSPDVGYTSVMSGYPDSSCLQSNEDTTYIPPLKKKDKKSHTTVTLSSLASKSNKRNAVTKEIIKDNTSLSEMGTEFGRSEMETDPSKSEMGNDHTKSETVVQASSPVVKAVSLSNGVEDTLPTVVTPIRHMNPPDIIPDGRGGAGDVFGDTEVETTRRNVSKPKKTRKEVKQNSSDPRLSTHDPLHPV